LNYDCGFIMKLTYKGWLGFDFVCLLKST
jgi:hypothetical protein